MTYNYHLEVCDGYDACDTSSVSYTVAAESNATPMPCAEDIEIQLTDNCSDDVASESFTLTSCSSDQDNAIEQIDTLECRWIETGGLYYDSGELSAANCSVDMDSREAGIYSFTLEVCDPYSACDAISNTVTLLDEDTERGSCCRCWRGS